MKTVHSHEGDHHQPIHKEKYAMMNLKVLLVKKVMYLKIGN